MFILISCNILNTNIFTIFPLEECGKKAKKGNSTKTREGQSVKYAIIQLHFQKIQSDGLSIHIHNAIMHSVTCVRCKLQVVQA